MAATRAALPDVFVQDSIYEVYRGIKDGSVKPEAVWVEFGSHEVRLTLEPNLEFVSPEKGYFASISEAAMLLELHSPPKRLTLARLGEIRAVLSETGTVTTGDVYKSRAIVGDSSGGLKVIDVANPEMNIDLEGHLLHTSVARFFPSGQVALSAGMDFSIKLWDLTSESQIQTLRYQKGLVTDLALIERGRNLLSLCPQDPERAVVLWEVGKPQVVHEYNIPGALSLALWAKSSIGEEDNSPMYNVTGKEAIVGTESRTLLLDARDPSTRNTLVDEKSDALAVNNHTLLRSNDKAIVGMDLRNPSELLFSLTSPLPATRLALTPSKAFIQTTGNVYGYDIALNMPEVMCCQANTLATWNDELFTLGKDLRHFPL